MDKKNELPKWRLSKPIFLKRGDKRYAAHLNQIRKYGFSDSETWSLDTTIASFLLPRLIRFKEVNNGYPALFDKSEEWDAVLDKIIYSFSCVLVEDFEDYQDPEYIEGLTLFARYLTHLWW